MTSQRLIFSAFVYASYMANAQMPMKRKNPTHRDVISHEMTVATMKIMPLFVSPL